MKFYGGLMSDFDKTTFLSLKMPILRELYKQIMREILLETVLFGVF